MSRVTKRFSRKVGNIPYRRLFVLAVEGAKTEPQYFAFINNLQRKVTIRSLTHKYKTSPLNVLDRIKEYLKKNRLSESDEAWVVIDKDEWSNDQLTQVFNWSKLRGNYGVAVSNPKFEFWLLLHFEDGDQVTSSQSCSNRLRQYLPEYDKGIESRKITKDQIPQAIDRARKKDTPPCTEWPKSPGVTTVYILVDKIMQESLQD